MIYSEELKTVGDKIWGYYPFKFSYHGVILLAFTRWYIHQAEKTDRQANKRHDTGRYYRMHLNICCKDGGEANGRVH